MKAYLVTICIFLSMSVFAQEASFYGTYDQMIYSMDDYVYVGADTVLVSTKNCTKEEGFTIELNERYFKQSGYHGLNSSKMIAPLAKMGEDMEFFIYADGYDEKWTLVKYRHEGILTMTVYYEVDKVRPVYNYTMYADKCPEPNQVAAVLAKVFNRKIENFGQRVLISRDKYTIMDDPELSEFCKKLTRPRGK